MPISAKKNFDPAVVDVKTYASEWTPEKVEKVITGGESFGMSYTAVSGDSKIFRDSVPEQAIIQNPSPSRMKARFHSTRLQVYSLRAVFTCIVTSLRVVVMGKIFRVTSEDIMETIGEAFSEMNGPMTMTGVKYALFHKIPWNGADLNPSRIVLSVTRMAIKILGAIVIGEISDTRHFGFDLVFQNTKFRGEEVVMITDELHGPIQTMRCTAGGELLSECSFSGNTSLCLKNERYLNEWVSSETLFREPADYYAKIRNFPTRESHPNLKILCPAGEVLTGLAFANNETDPTKQGVLARCGVPSGFGARWR